MQGTRVPNTLTRRLAVADMTRYLALTAILAILGFTAYQMRGVFSDARTESEVGSTYLVVRRTIEDRVVERGTVESQKTVYGKCELPRRSKITFIVPEGSEVQKGDRVVEFESNETQVLIDQKNVEINEAMSKQDEAEQALKIQQNKNDTDIATAQLEYELAVIDLEKYELGTFVAEEAEMERAIKEDEAELEKVSDEKKSIEILVKKGYRSPQQLREYELLENKFQFAVVRDKQKLRVLVEYELKRQMTELKAKAAENKLKLVRAKETAKAELLKAKAAVTNAENGVKILQDQLNELQEQLGKCVLLAEQDGTVAYANERWYDASERIREGTEMYSGRDVYYLPDMTRMQVKASVHESVIDRIKNDQNVAIRLDAFSDRKLSGTVSSVANMAASSWSSVQNYEVIVLIDSLPTDLAIKPGMTAAVDILVGTYEDVVAVPVGAITEHFEQTYVYVISDGIGVRQKVETGRVTHSFIEITKGLEPGSVVALDAYQRGLEDFAEAERDASQGSTSLPIADAP